MGTGNETRALPSTHPATLIATVFGIGRLPFAPGTWGSLVALPLAWAAERIAGPAGLALLALAIFAAGWWASSRVVAASGADDPGEIVIDEVAAQLMVLLAVPPDVLLYAIGFALFRLADILKPWPTSWADRNVKGGFGIMLDDLLAAFYSAVALYGAAWAMGRS